MHERVIDETKKYIKQVLDQGLDQGDNLKYLGELIDIQKDTYKIICMKEGDNMYGEYGNYGRGRRAGYDSYGRDNYGNYGEYNDGYGRGSYGRRGVDSRYRGHDHLDRMMGEYGRYEESRERYGAGEESEESYRYMTEALKDFTKYLFETADTPQQKQMLREAIQNSMM